MKKTRRLIELHSHLEGTITAKTLIQLAADGREHFLPTVDESELQSILTQTGYESFLNYFKITRPFRYLIDDIRKITFTELERAVNNNVIYAEYRFNPLGPAKKGTDPWDILITIKDVMESFEKHHGLKTSLLFGLVREDGPEKMTGNLDMAYKAWQEGLIAGIDLNGDEKNYPTELFIKPFIKIKETNCPITIHAGEWAGPNSIKAAIKCGAKRIGHGAKAIEDRSVMDILKKEKITLELCPTSNVCTGVFTKIEDHPIKQLYDYGIPITINSDDPAIFNSDIANEYFKIKDIFAFTNDDIIKINKNAVTAAFLPDYVKNDLVKNLN